MIRDVHPVSGFFSIPDRGSRGQKLKIAPDPGSATLTDWLYVGFLRYLRLIIHLTITVVSVIFFLVFCFIVRLGIYCNKWVLNFALFMLPQGWGSGFVWLPAYSFKLQILDRIIFVMKVPFKQFSLQFSFSFSWWKQQILTVLKSLKLEISIFFFLDLGPYCTVCIECKSTTMLCR